ncbi:hypothetical protein HMPREF1556_00526 [Porphyromonas sp. oral taxon 278 str. W7784]|nr:hypothetical protein HMPREF1556_00526 [Porphyromonas sp. oral taxon 278 str. W7784]
MIKYPSQLSSGASPRVGALQWGLSSPLKASDLPVRTPKRALLGSC